MSFQFYITIDFLIIKWCNSTVWHYAVNDNVECSFIPSKNKPQNYANSET